MIAATSWFLVTLAGLGLPLAAMLAGADGRQRWQSGHDLPALAALSLMLGLLADHAAGLLGGSLAVQAILAWGGGFLAIGGLAVLARAGIGANPIKILAATGFISLLAMVIYAVPILEWDARSIWFFHAKAIFFDGGLKASPFWSNPAYDWSHKDYPTLLPMLAARYGAFAGVWNEYAPKGALVPLGAAAFLGLSAASRTASLSVLIPMILAVLGASLWNGYMDGWVALYAGVAVLAFAAWLESGCRIHLGLGMAALGVVLCLKNEGQLVLAVCLPVIFWAVAAHRRSLRWSDLSVLIVLLPFALWFGVKAKLALHGDLESAGLLHRAVGVAGNGGELMYRLSYLAEDAFTRSHLFAALGAWLATGLCVGFRRSALVCGLAGALYAGGLVMVYLGTPQEFVWHVSTSLDRVLLTPTLLFLCGLSTMIPDIISACRTATPPPVS